MLSLPLFRSFPQLLIFTHPFRCGTPGPGNQIPFDIHAFLLGSKTYTGLCEGDSNPEEFIPFLIKLHSEGKFPVEKISKVFKAEEIEEALHAM